MRPLPHICIVVAATLLIIGQSAPARAADNDAQAWLTLSLRKQVAPRVDINADIIARLSDDRDGIAQSIGRLTASYHLSDAVSVQSSYAHFISYDDGDVTQRENRFAYNLVWRLGHGAGGDWTSRSTIETRLVDGAQDTGWRYRQRIGYSRPLSQHVRLNLSSEAFFALNDTDFGSEAGFSGLRSSAGIAFPLSHAATLELGYLNQWARRSARPDVLIHAAAATLSIRL